MASGPPRAIVDCAASYTGQFLKQVLEPAAHQKDISIRSD